jgi:hypothetical protein
MKTRKFTYYKVIQTNHGYGWNDDDFHETDSTFWPLDRNAFKENLKAYRANTFGRFSVRVINRRELNA